MNMAEKIEDRGFLERLSLARIELNAPKNQYSEFGGYHYRSADDVLQAVKPLNLKYFMHLELTDEVVLIGERYYMKATAKLFDMKDEKREPIIVHAYAQEPMKKAKMDESQVTGSASSYARKYALNGLYLIDDNKDADTDAHKQEVQKGQQQMQQEQQNQQKQFEQELNQFKQYLMNNGEDIQAMENWIAEQEKVNRIEQVPFNRVYAQFKRLASKKRSALRDMEQAQKKQQETVRTKESEQTSLMDGNTTTVKPEINWGQ